MLAKYDNPECCMKGLTPAVMEKGNLFEFTEMLNEDLFKTGSAISAHLPNTRDPARPVSKPYGSKEARGRSIHEV
jgi:hypothetical protein